jgi:hypothetical protein
MKSQTIFLDTTLVANNEHGSGEINIPPEWTSGSDFDTSRRLPLECLEPLQTLQNPSLVTSLYPISIGEARYKLTKSLVLGKRAGGAPIRLSVFGGIDAERSETVHAAARLLMLLTLKTSLAQDYAVFGYPWVNPAGFTDSSGALSGVAKNIPANQVEREMARRWQTDPYAPDALFLRAEFQRIAPHGIITLRSTGTSSSLCATVNSALIGKEVVAPALHRLKGLVPVHEEPVKVLPTDMEDRWNRFLEGHLIPHPDAPVWPFEIELDVPANVSFEVRTQVLILATLDILRSYREFVCHGGDL